MTVFELLYIQYDKLLSEIEAGVKTSVILDKAKIVYDIQNDADAHGLITFRQTCKLVELDLLIHEKLVERTRALYEKI